jgi:hypothetical protein
MPSKTLMAALTLDALVGTILTFVGLPDLMPLPWWQTLAILGYPDSRDYSRRRHFWSPQETSDMYSLNSI